MEAVEKKILELLYSGNDIKLPAGKGIEGSNSSIVMIAGYCPEINECVLVVVPYKRRSISESIKKKRLSRVHHRVEDPLMIAIREVREETKIALFRDKLIEAANKAVADTRPNKGNRIHRKHLIFAKDYNASLMRRTLIPEEPNLGIPFLITISLFERYVASSHRWCLPYINMYFKHHTKELPIISLKNNTFHKEVVRTLIA